MPTFCQNKAFTAASWLKALEFLKILRRICKSCGPSRLDSLRHVSQAVGV